MLTRSPWLKKTPSLDFPPLRRKKNADTVVVGAGITGLTAALRMQKAGQSVIVIDSHQIGQGETGHTTGHITQILDTRYHKILSDFGLENAKRVLDSTAAALTHIEDRVQELKIDCDFERVPGFLFNATEAERKSKPEDLEKEFHALERIGMFSTIVDNLPIPLKAVNALRVEDQAQFHPHKYLIGLATEFVRAGGHLYENTRALDVSEGHPCRVETDRGTLLTNDVLMATNVPINNRVLVNTKISAYRSYALAARLRMPIARGLYWDTEKPYHYFRTQRTADETFLIVGGEDHKTGTRTDTHGSFRNLESYARENFDIEEPAYYWSGQIIEPADGLPYIGRNSFSNHVYVATGFSGNGMTFGTLAGLMLSDMVLGLKNPWESLYDATRIHAIASAKTFVSENKDYPYYLITDRLKRPENQTAEDLAPNEGRIVTLDGEKVAAFKSGDGILHCMSAVCPHLGCHVHWNTAEQSWDCPCHGSRFDAMGRVLNGPALSDLKPLHTTTLDSPERATG